MNLYVHFPFCRRKCTYCALHSRVGVSSARRAGYVDTLAQAVRTFDSTDSGHDQGGVASRRATQTPAPSAFKTVYFGGGSPALCDLVPLLDALAPRVTADTEFTVELHPLDVTHDLLATLRQGGVNRISMGVQSLDDAVLAHMGRGYTADEAERAFALVKGHFDNAGIDLIVGYPTPTRGDTHAAVRESPCSLPGDIHAWQRLSTWGLTHCSVYSLILEEKSVLYHKIKNQEKKKKSQKGLSQKNPLFLPDDDEVLDQIRAISRFLQEIGMERYEISNYAIPGRECRHNLAVWRGEDYFGLGEGAHGRIGRLRTRHACRLTPVPDEGHAFCAADAAGWGQSPAVETVSGEFDRKERKLFRLRTREGLDTSEHPEWGRSLDRLTAEGLLTKHGPVYRLTERGTEVCDAILAELI